MFWSKELINRISFKSQEQETQLITKQYHRQKYVSLASSRHQHGPLQTVIRGWKYLSGDQSQYGQYLIAYCVRSSRNKNEISKLFSHTHWNAINRMANWNWRSQTKTWENNRMRNCTKRIVWKTIERVLVTDNNVTTIRNFDFDSKWIG